MKLGNLASKAQENNTLKDKTPAESVILISIDTASKYWIFSTLNYWKNIYNYASNKLFGLSLIQAVQPHPHLKFGKWNAALGGYGKNLNGLPTTNVISPNLMKKCNF